jgi:penicillin amidase
MFDDLIPKNVSDHIPSLPGYTGKRKKYVLDKKEKSNIKINSKKGIKNACTQARDQNEVRLKVLKELGFPSREGSYMFMMGGKMTEGNDSFFISGPQSEFFYPSRFPETGLHCPGMNVLGISVFGVPAIFIGSTENIAFGITSNLANLSDVFILTLTRDNYHYIYKGKRKKMKKRTETIKIKGKKAIRFDVYSSVYGPVTQWGNGVAFTLKQSWQGELMKTFVGMIKLMQSKNNAQFLEACSKINCAVNYGWTDDQGNFGYVYCGKIPNTNPQVDLRLPTPGTGEYDWQGYHPFSWNPKGTNIRRGYIVNWNNIPTLDFEYNDGYLGYWNSYCRVYRLHKLLDKMDKVTFADAKALIKDIATINLHGDYLFPYFEKALKDETDPRLVKAINIVRNWVKYNVDEDDDGFYDGAGYTIWKAWIEEIFTSAFADELGSHFFLHDAYFVYTPFLPNLVIHHLEGKSSAVPIKYKSWLNGNTMEQIIRSSLAKIMNKLESQYADLEMEKWLTPVIPHKFDPGFFPGIPGGPIGVRDLHVYMYRGTHDQIVRFSNGKIANSVNINPPGQSGFVHPNGKPSPHFHDQLDLFEDFKGYKPMHVYLTDAIADAQSIEILQVKVKKK